MREAIAPDKESFVNAYQKEKVSVLKWVTGSASKELIDLIWENEISPGSEVLEVGCGIGTESVFLAVRGMKVTAIDISPESLEIGRELAKIYDVQVNFRNEDVLNLPFEKDAFDVVCDRGCFHCFEGKDRMAYAREIIRVCKPGGTFILRCFSERNNTNLSWIRASESKDLLNLFSKEMDLEHLERISSLPKPNGDRSEAWYTIWKKRAH